LSFVARGENTDVIRAVSLLVALALTGCNGGTVDRHALTNDASTIDSINCEAWLLSRAVSRDRVTVYFAREQAEELAVQAANLADALAHRPTATGLERRVRVRGSDASVLASRLWRLHDRPSDRAGARMLADAFKKAGSCS
jgi:hypothetical protein